MIPEHEIQLRAIGRVMGVQYDTPDPVITVARIWKSREGNPAYWKGRTETGFAIYAKYSHGNLRVGIGSTTAGAIRDSLRTPIFQRRFTVDIHGSWILPDLKSHTSGAIVWP